MEDKIQIILNNKKSILVNKGITLREIVNNNYRLNKATNINLFDGNDINGYKMYQAGLKFVLEVAIKKTFGKNVDIVFDHSIARGVHTTIINKDNFNLDDTALLKNAMQKIIKDNLSFIKLNIESKEAIAFYNKIGYVEKALNIHNITNQVIALYKLDNCINYFYVEMPDATGVLNKFDLAYIKDNEIALMFPTPHSNNSIPEYIHYSKIIDCFKNGKDWLNKIGIPYISNINKIISNGSVIDLIRTCETNFDNSVHDVALRAIKDNIKFLLIAGPSSSGKTTTAKKISLNLKAQGMETITISTDDYFLNREDSPKNSDGTYNFEGIDAMDIKGLNDDLNALINGKIVDLPTYNFIAGKQEHNGHLVQLKDNSIVVMAGLHCLNDMLTKDVDN